MGQAKVRGRKYDEWSKGEGRVMVVVMVVVVATMLFPRAFFYIGGGEQREKRPVLGCGSITIALSDAEIMSSVCKKEEEGK